MSSVTFKQISLESCEEKHKPLQEKAGESQQTSDDVSKSKNASYEELLGERKMQHRNLGEDCYNQHHENNIF